MSFLESGFEMKSYRERFIKNHRQERQLANTRKGYRNVLIYTGDFYTWDQHGTWGDDLGVPYVGSGFERDTKASMQWSEDEAPDATWSEYRTWGDASWDKEPTGAGTCETGTWIDLEEETV